MCPLPRRTNLAQSSAIRVINRCLSRFALGEYRLGHCQFVSNPPTRLRSRSANSGTMDHEETRSNYLARDFLTGVCHNNLSGFYTSLIVGGFSGNLVCLFQRDLPVKSTKEPP